MTHEDAETAVELALAQGWRNRRHFYEFVLRVPSCHAIVGCRDDRLVATGIATNAGPVGWLGGVIVAADWRGRGMGTAVTEALMIWLRTQGCETLSLEATDEGLPLYERIGFRLVTWYHQLQADHLPIPPAPPPGSHVRQARQADLPAILELDRQATGEDRSPALTVLAEGGAWLLEDEGGEADGRLRGFLMPAERAYGVVIAPRPEDGLYLLDLHRVLVPPGAHVRAGVPHENAAGWGALEAAGWHETWRAPRLLLGPDIEWQPTWIWGQLNSAMG